MAHAVIGVQADTVGRLDVGQPEADRVEFGSGRHTQAALGGEGSLEAGVPRK